MKKPIQKFINIIRPVYEWIKEAVKFTTTVIALTAAGILFWLGLGIIYVQSARFVGEWLKIVVATMNGGSI